MLSALTSRLLALALLIGCAPGVAVDREPIVGGSADDGDSSVYFLNDSLGTCTSSLVSPHVVLTARHCLVGEDDVMVSPSSVLISVGTGPSFTASYHASALYTIEGATTLSIAAGAPDDLGLVVLTEAAVETPLVMDFESPSSFVGQSLTSIGFGRTPDGTVGIKRTVTTHVSSFQLGLFWTPPSVCPGDSGGPGIGPDGHIYGVAVVYENAPGDVSGALVCGTAVGGYNPIDIHMDWIRSIIQSTGDACFPHAETCDALDDDCDGTIDEGCLADGAPCDDASTCLSLRCEAIGGSHVCTRACDPTRGPANCAAGLRCVRTEGCDGLCMPDDGIAARATGAACESDAQCASGSCVDPGDGARRCLSVCHGDVGDCVAGEVCTGAEDACGACVPEAIFGSPHGLGESCTSDASCRSGHCAMLDGAQVCAEPCENGACADGFSCRDGFCALSRNQPDGGVCLAQSDCADGRCLAQGPRAWCTADCTTSACPHGFTCDDIGGGSHACAPTLALAGESCGATNDCASGTCVAGACADACTRTADCGPGLACVRDADGLMANCRRPGSASRSSGCAVGLDGRARIVPIGILLAVIARRRRRR